MDEELIRKVGQARVLLDEGAQLLAEVKEAMQPKPERWVERDRRTFGMARFAKVGGGPDDFCNVYRPFADYHNRTVKERDAAVMALEAVLEGKRGDLDMNLSRARATLRSIKNGTVQ